MADECNFVFPTDLVIEREDVPSVCGVREGSGILYYKCKKHPEWSVFILKGTWEDNILHGSFSLYHNTHELLYGVYKQGVLFFKGKRCDKGIQITEHGCFPIKSEQIISRESSKVITIIPSEKKEEPIQLTDAGENEDEESFPCEDEQISDSEEESDEDKSDDGEEDTDETPSFRVKEKESGEKQRYKQIIYSHLTSTIQCHFVEYENPSSHRILWYFLSSQYCLITTATGSIPRGTCFLYSLQPLRLVCIGKVRRSSSVESLRLVNESTNLHKKERAVMDLGSSGVRWEGEIKNQLPNGEGEFYNNNNELIYQGMTIGGYANGFGKAFFPGGEVSYYGMWKGNQRHGVGKEYDRKGTFICDGIWIEGKKAECLGLVNDMNVPTLNLSHYPPITKCMFINDSVYRSTPLVITRFPFLEAVFLTVRSIHSVPVTLRNLPSLRKFVLEETKKMYPELPLFIRKCPKLNEIWLSVSFKHGVIEVIDDDEFKDRFVLQELKDSMKWKQTGDIDRDSINQYFPPQHYSYTDENDFPLGSAGGKYYESNTIPKGVWNCHTPLSLFFNRYDYLDLDKTVDAHYRHVHYFGYWKKE